MRQRQWLVSIFICTFTRSLEHTNFMEYNVLQRANTTLYFSARSVPLPQHAAHCTLLIIFCILNTVRYERRALNGASLARLSPLFVFVLFGWRWSMVLRCVFRLFHFHFNRNSSTNDICLLLLLLPLFSRKRSIELVIGGYQAGNGNGGDANVIIRVIEINALRMLIKTIWRHTHRERDRRTAPTKYENNNAKRCCQIHILSKQFKFQFVAEKWWIIKFETQNRQSERRSSGGQGMSACGGNVSWLKTRVSSFSQCLSV